MSDNILYGLDLDDKTDEEVLASADSEGVLLLTADKDFGELVYRRQLAHCGVMLLRQAGLSFTV